MGKNDGEGSPNWCSSNDPDPVDCVELDPVYTSVLSSAIWQIYSRKKNQKYNSGECWSNSLKENCDEIAYDLYYLVYFDLVYTIFILYINE